MNPLLYLTAPIIALAQQAPPPMPETCIIENVPYVGDDWENRNEEGPEDFAFPTCLRSVVRFLGEDRRFDYKLFYGVCGMEFEQLWEPGGWDAPFGDPFIIHEDPLDGVRRAFEAVGYDWRIVGNEAVCEELGLPLDGFDEYTDEDGIRLQVMQTIAAGTPVIAFGRGYGGAVFAGYEDLGASVVGWSMPSGDQGVGETEHGYVRWLDWLPGIAAIISVGEKGEQPPLEETYRKMLTWAVQAARRAELNGYAAGHAAFDEWQAALARDADVSADDMATLKKRLQAHWLFALTLAEGRAYAGTMCERAAAAFPEAAEELQAAQFNYHIIHDLQWRIWQTEGGMGEGDRQAQRFVQPAVREHLREIVAHCKRQDLLAIAHLERALTAMGVPPEAIPPAREPADLASEHVPGADPAAFTLDGVDLWAEGVPMLEWRQGKDCSFVGALEAALAPTQFPYAYAELMGYSGLAFRTRWFHNPEREETEWGSEPFHPVSPHGEQPVVIEALSRATGWRFRVEDVPEDTDAPARHRLTTDIVMSTNARLPVLAGLNTDMACIFGYHIHSMNVFVRDYQHPDEPDFRIGASNEGFCSPFIFIEGHAEEPEPRDAVLEGLRLAVENGRRDPEDGFRYGLDALDTWREALEGYADLAQDERKSFQATNWWCVMHLLDARRAAVDFLETSADLLSDDAQAPLQRAISLYQDEADALQQLADANEDLIPWWGGLNAGPWDGATRQEQIDLLARARDLEEQALTALSEVLAAEQ